MSYVFYDNNNCLEVFITAIVIFRNSQKYFNYNFIFYSFRAYQLIRPLIILWKSSNMWSEFGFSEWMRNFTYGLQQDTGQLFRRCPTWRYFADVGEEKSNSHDFPEGLREVLPQNHRSYTTVCRELSND